MMAPDINSLPTSLRPQQQTSQPSSASVSRRASQVMGPPGMPASMISAPYAGLRSPTVSAMDQGLPLRHPRPLTAAELYLECEKEQEAVVNRLTRELSALRAQSASVASNTSHSSNSTSASLLPVDLNDPNPNHQMTGPTHPLPSRRHRSSSSLSTRSITSPSVAASTAGSTMSSHAQQGNTSGGVPLGGVSQASADRAAAAAGLSRQPSGRASGTSTPARHSMDLARSGHLTGTLHTLPHRPTISRDPSGSFISTAANAGSPIAVALPSPSQSPGHHLGSNLPQAVDTAAYRAEMEAVKAENEALKQRVRALERALRTRRRDSSHSDAQRPTEAAARAPRERESLDEPRSSGNSTTNVAAWAAAGGIGGVAPPRERSESQSTTASSRRPVGIVEDELRVGESAGSLNKGI